jgi:hypothetical protein
MTANQAIVGNIAYVIGTHQPPNTQLMSDVVLILCWLFQKFKAVSFYLNLSFGYEISLTSDS